MIATQGFSDSLVGHHEKASAIGQPPLLSVLFLYIFHPLPSSSKEADIGVDDLLHKNRSSGPRIIQGFHFLRNQTLKGFLLGSNRSCLLAEFNGFYDQNLCQLEEEDKNP